MRLYGGRFLKGGIGREIRDRNPIRNAVFYELSNDATSRAKVKIQGTDTFVYAWFPEYARKEMGRMKPGDAVRITHPDGNGGRIEVVGRGLVIPTFGGLAQKPPTGTNPDGVLSGGTVIAMPNDPSWNVIVRSATFRIGGTDYSTAGAAMSNTSTWYMGEGGTMGDVAEIFSLQTNKPSAGYFRYIAFEVGADGIVHKLVGASVTSDPVMPTASADHVLLPGFVLMNGSMTLVSQTDISRPWETPAPTSLSVTIADADLAWAELSTTITVNVLDQYGRAITLLSGNGWYITVAFSVGNGTIASSEEGSSTTIIGKHTGVGSSAAFTYTRDQLDPGDQSPVFEIVLHTDNAIYSYANIILRNAGGNPM